MNWQQQSIEFAQKQNLSHPPSVYVLDLISEVGEVAKEILLATDYGELAVPAPTGAHWRTWRCALQLVFIGYGR